MEDFIGSVGSSSGTYAQGNVDNSNYLALHPVDYQHGTIVQQSDIMKHGPSSFLEFGGSSGSNQHHNFQDPHNGALMVKTNHASGGLLHYLGLDGGSADEHNHDENAQNVNSFFTKIHHGSVGTGAQHGWFTSFLGGMGGMVSGVAGGMPMPMPTDNSGMPHVPGPTASLKNDPFNPAPDALAAQQAAMRRAMVPTHLGLNFKSVFYVAKTGFLIFGGMCSKMFGMGLIGYLAFQSMQTPRTMPGGGEYGNPYVAYQKPSAAAKSVAPRADVVKDSDYADDDDEEEEEEEDEGVAQNPTSEDKPESKTTSSSETVEFQNQDIEDVK